MHFIYTLEGGRSAIGDFGHLFPDVDGWLIGIDGNNERAYIFDHKLNFTVHDNCVKFSKRLSSLASNGLIHTLPLDVNKDIFLRMGILFGIFGVI